MTDRIDPAEVLAESVECNFWPDADEKERGYARRVAADLLAALSEHFVLVPRSLPDDGPVAVVAGEDGPEVRRLAVHQAIGSNVPGMALPTFYRLADDTEEGER